MKEYRVQPAFHQQVLRKRLIETLRIFIIAGIILIPLLYYLHPRTEPYENWAAFWSSSSNHVIGIIFTGVFMIGTIWGWFMTRKLLRTLSVSVHPDHVSWAAYNKPENKIFFSDMTMLNTKNGRTFRSKANPKLFITVPVEIDDYEELCREADQGYQRIKG